jgi:hypothetical protein
VKIETKRRPAKINPQSAIRNPQLNDPQSPILDLWTS